MAAANLDFESFAGGYSYTPAEMRELFRHLAHRPTYNVLEFGCGDSTVKLYNMIKGLAESVEYDAFETDAAYAVNYPGITVHMYSADAIAAAVIPDKIYDLVLVDGPPGRLRSEWYAKLRGHVGPHTVLLVDDFNHHACFGEELDRNFEYTTLSHADTPFRPWGEHSWKIVTELRERGPL